MKRFLLYVFAISFVFTEGCNRSAFHDYHDGDLIFQTSRSAQSVAIQEATHSKYSHMGIIFFKHGKPYVLEAVSTVKYTPLDTWIRRGEGAHFVVKRLRKSGDLLTKTSLEKMRKTAQGFVGKSYDPVFEWSDDRIYCSELVWKIYNRALNIQIGRLQKLSDLDLTSSAVKAKLQERYGSDLPLEEEVISPAAMISSNLLTTVYQQ